MKHPIRIKRVYDRPAVDDGARVLVDRLWPRGMSKEKAKIVLWLKDVAPSNGLRRWFAHKEERWEAFTKKYRQELKDRGELIEQLQAMAKTRTVTLLFAAQDAERNNAVVLQDVLRKK